MRKEKIEHALYENESGKKVRVYYNDLDGDSYSSQYKNHMTCINGCKARIKFTQRKDNNKFFSTWNREGNKHNNDCQYNVIYRGKIGRKNLKAFYESQIISDEHIEDSLMRKIKRLKRNYDDIELPKVKLSTLQVENIGEGIVKVDIDSNGTIKKENGRNPYIMSINAQYVDPSYIGTRKCVFGYIRNVKIGINKNGTRYAYLNLISGKYNISVCLAEAFYSNEYLSDDSLFEKYISILEEEIDDSNASKRYIVVCYGYIDKKIENNKGINVYIINPKHIFINDMSFNQVLNELKIKQIDYDVI